MLGGLYMWVWSGPSLALGQGRCAVPFPRVVYLLQATPSIKMCPCPQETDGSPEETPAGPSENKSFSNKQAQGPDSHCDGDDSRSHRRQEAEQPHPGPGALTGQGPGRP